MYNKININHIDSGYSHSQL